MHNVYFMVSLRGEENSTFTQLTETLTRPERG